MEIDILTRQPRIFDDKREERIAEEKARLEKHRDVGMEVEGQLGSSDGNIFLNLVEEQLISRVEELVKQDEQCQSLLMMLRSLGGTIDLGRSAAKRLMEIALRLNK